MSEENTAAPHEIHWDLEDTHPDLVPKLREALAQIVDPEIGLNVLQLGLIRKVSVEKGEGKMYVLLTTPFCPYGPAMLETIKNQSQEALGMVVNVELGVEPWDFSMMEDPSALNWGMYT